MMILIANQQLTGDYGTVFDGECFECAPEVGEKLIASGLAHPRYAPGVQYETKVVTPEAPLITQEVKPQSALPFRDLSDPHEGPPALAAVRDAVRAVSDLSVEGNTRRIERRQRRRPAAE